MSCTPCDIGQYVGSAPVTLREHLSYGPAPHRPAHMGSRRLLRVAVRVAVRAAWHGTAWHGMPAQSAPHSAETLQGIQCEVPHQ